MRQGLHDRQMFDVAVIATRFATAAGAAVSSRGMRPRLSVAPRRN